MKLLAQYSPRTGVGGSCLTLAFKLGGYSGEIGRPAQPKAREGVAPDLTTEKCYVVREV